MQELQSPVKFTLINQLIACRMVADSPGLMYALLHFGSQHPKQLAPFRQELLAFFCESALGAKLPVSAEKLDAYSPLAGQLSQVEFGSTVLPAILKYVRRTPDAALVSITALLSATQLDLSSSAHDLMDQLLKLVRGSKESVRCVLFWLQHSKPRHSLGLTCLVVNNGFWLQLCPTRFVMLYKIQILQSCINACTLCDQACKLTRRQSTCSGSDSYFGYMSSGRQP